MLTLKRRPVGNESRETLGLADSILGGGGDSEQGRDISQSYQPRILKKPIALTGILLLVLLGAAILVLEHVINDVFSGLVWTLGHVSSTTDGPRWEHYLSSLPTIILVVISSAIYGFMVALHNALKGMEPYRRLSHGNASANESLLLDYISMPSIHSTYCAIKNGHFIVATSGVAALLALTLSPLASTVFVVRVAPHQQEATMHQTQSIGLPFEYDEPLAAAYHSMNFLASKFLSGAPLPPYVTESWAFPSFDLEETGMVGTSNSTLHVPNYPGLLSRANCEDTSIEFSSKPADLDSGFPADAVGKSSGRIITLHVAYDPPLNCYLVDHLSCLTQSLGYYGLPSFDIYVTSWLTNVSIDFPYYFAFVSTISSPLTVTKPPDDAAVASNVSAIVCYPTVELQQVQVSFDAATGTVAAFNAISFTPDETTVSDLTTMQRLFSVQSGVQSVISEAALALPGGLSEVFASNAHYDIVSSVYQTYLSLVAQSTYFNSSFPNSTSMPVTLTITANKLFVSKISAVIMCSVLMVLAVLALAGIIAHHRAFSLHLRADPGTMAGKAMMLVGGSDVAHLLADPEMTRREMKSTLREHRWALVGGKVCVVNEGRGLR
ncbi:hypothetical protein FA95DRAFT_1608006 [Auriscalpium vulgare]|uniref:Uncharacterized protein n=1 Tax=Auriscalpium vulgare TaxID=40419 RepID=A0ACB8RLM0_9AGAM|nr:hypothetical protein FA95DRAFT_1608006 [Auriscalpium vulgare]